ncbi:MAG: aspartate aminotransferase family protein [Planctomycetes bacterium]|nr:aspartate aminotransferase family protein [Planctomycetota bacterium]
MNTQQTIEMFQKFVVPNYVRFPVSLERGEGSYVWDAEGNRYLDLFPGWGCNLLGHCPPKVVEAVCEQVRQLIHVPNTWYMEAQGRWAEALSRISFGGQAFFCNSGAEANESAIKLARLHTPEERYKIITFEKGFHGRTIAATTATAQPAYHQGLGPLMAGFVYAPYGDLETVRSLVDEETCAIMVEPIQGEGGINIPDAAFLPGLRALCDEQELLLIFDEVQTGMGRTGQWFGYQHHETVPDVMSLAKALGGGLACGGIMTNTTVAPSLRPGMHACTFGGNPIAARAGLATIETLDSEGLLEHTRLMAEQFRERLEALASDTDVIREVRVLGMMIGIELEIEAAPLVQKCMEQGLLVNATQQTVLRLLPAMNISSEQVEDGCNILSSVIRQAV